MGMKLRSILKNVAETNWKETIGHHLDSNRQMIFSSSEKGDEVSIEDKSRHQFKLRVSQ